MPKEYEAIRDSIFTRLKARGVPAARALKQAKSEGAAVYNSRRAPGTPPVTGKPGT